MYILTDELGHSELIDNNDVHNIMKCGDWYNPLSWFEDPAIKKARLDAKVQAIRDQTSADWRRRSQKSFDDNWARSLRNAESNYLTVK